MKFRVTLKDPDGFSDAIQDAVTEEVRKLGLDADETEQLIEMRTSKAGDDLKHWVQYGEYVVIEFDTDAGTAVVVPR